MSEILSNNLQNMDNWGNDQFNLSLPETSTHLPYMADQQNNYPYENNGTRGPVSAASESYTELNTMRPHDSPVPHSMPQQPPMYQIGGVMHDGNPHFPPQNMYIPPISQQQAQMLAAHTTGGYMGHGVGHSSLVYTNAAAGLHHQTGHPMMGSGPMMQQNLYYQRSQLAPNGGSPTSGGSPSPGSEDSDDSNAQTQGRTKRPSQDVIAEPVIVKGKKARVSKKSKKKKDPNEPQKPVSAYALFFRDTQAAIKGQNPNASFGEISKIVASMWDSLDPERKSYYKKKTEAAKKEYLKLLAAYRASLVSKGEGDPNLYGGGSSYGQLGANPPYGYPGATPQPQGHSPPQLSPMGKKGPLLNTMMGHESNQSLMNPPMSQPMPPSAPGMMPHGLSAMNPIGQHPGQMSHPQMISHLNQVVPPSSPYMTQSNPSLSSPVSSMGSDVGSPGHMHSTGQPSQQNSVPPQQPSPEHQSPNAQPPASVGQGQHSPNQPTGQQQGQNGTGPCNGGSCIRSGCTNPAVHNPEWEDEYCSNECVVSHCRDVFNTWVGNNPQNSQSYPASVK